MKKRINLRGICQTGLFTAAIIIFAQINFPTPWGVPATMQTFAIPFAAVVLGARYGTASAMVYVALGAFGLPVFAGLKGGLGLLVGPTGGFILSFPLMAFVSGIAADSGRRSILAVGITAGAVLNYFSGMVMYSAVMDRGLYDAFALCVLPYLPVDIAKLIAAGIAGVYIRGLLGRKQSAVHNP